MDVYDIISSICVQFFIFFMLCLNWHVHLQIPHLRPAEYKRSRLSRNRRTVNRAYGGVLSGGAVRERSVIKYFLFSFRSPFLLILQYFIDLLALFVR